MTGTESKITVQIMKAPPQHRGPWIHQVLVWFFSLLFSVLVYWLLGFVVRDIGSWPGPAYQEVEKRLLDASLRTELDLVKTEIEDNNRLISEQRQRQTVLRDSTSNSEKTMNQLLELQRLTLQTGVHPSAEETKALTESEKLFLDNQRKYQEINDRVSVLSEQLRGLEARQRAVQKQAEERRQPVREEYQRLQTRHQLKLAALKLSFLVPLLAVAVWLFIKKRPSLYAPLIYGLGVAVLAKVVLVMHEHFPRRYFKYVLIMAALLLVARVLVYLLRMVAFPRQDWLLKQYREAYERFFCPVCGYPIRRGPLKYLFWSRRSLKKLAPATETPNGPDQPYTCPVCGTRLFEECAACKAIRHSLLPVCSQCGAEKAIATGSPGATP